VTIVARIKNTVLIYCDGVLRVYRGYNSSDLGTLGAGTYRPGARVKLGYSEPFGRCRFVRRNSHRRFHGLSMTIINASINFNVELFIYNATIIVDTRLAKPRYNITALKTFF
jgi:hypothetical protein